MKTIPFKIEREFNSHEEVIELMKSRLEKTDNLPTTYYSFHLMTDEGEFVVTQGESDIFFDFHKENNTIGKLYLIKIRRYLGREDDNSLISFDKY